jgi:hypothetical protein
MQSEQSVAEMAEEVLSRQARARARRTGSISGRGARGRHSDPSRLALEQLRSGLHKDEEARYWQASLLFERLSAQAGHPV